MDKSDIVYSPTIRILMRNSEGKKLYLKIPTSKLQQRLQEIRTEGLDLVNVSYNDYSRTISIKDMERKILSANLALVKRILPIPARLSSVLSYCYDRDALIYEGTIEGRDTEREKLVTFITTKNKSNCVLVGNGGVGKTTIVHDFARKLIQQDCPEQLKGSVVVRVNLNGIPKSLLRNLRFYSDFKKFIKKNKDKLILFFPSLEDLENYPEMADLFDEEDHR